MKTYNFLYTFEPENKGTLPVLDMSLSRNGRELTTTIYKKKINLDIYLNWIAFAPVSWKRGMLRTLTKRAYPVCLTETCFKEELTHLEKRFHRREQLLKICFQASIHTSKKGTKK